MFTHCQHCGATLALGAIACFRCGRMLDDGRGGTTGGGELPTELQTLAKAGLLENQWRLIRPIGQGKSGVVWEAQDVALDRRVAVKVLHESLVASPAHVSRFEREARVLAALDHPNLTPVLGSGRFEGRPFTVMRLLTGRTVAELLHARGGKLSLTEVSFCLAPVCEALQTLHDAHVVHRDLKPSNVFIGDDGRVTLLDLGQAFEVGSDLTRAGDLIGAPGYLAPEQIAAQKVDARTDVYALGCLMHELFTGAPPFTGELAEVLRAHATAPRPPAASMPDGAGAVVVKMLSVDPAGRPPLSEVRSLLQAYAPPSIALPPVAGVQLPDRERSRSTHRQVERERDTTPSDAVPAQTLVEDPTRPLAPLSVLITGGSAAARREEPTAPAAPVSPLAAEATVVHPNLLLRARPEARPLSGAVKAAMLLAAAALLTAVAVGLAQPEAPLPEPVRVDQPRVPVKVAKAEPPPVPAPPGPPAEAVVSAPPAPLPLLEERKAFANAGPLVARAPKLGKKPDRSKVANGALRITTTWDGDIVPALCRFDGKLAGMTPVTIEVVPPGDHTILIELDEGTPRVVLFPVPANARLKEGIRLEIELDPAWEATADVAAKRRIPPSIPKPDDRPRRRP